MVVLEAGSGGAAGDCAGGVDEVEGGLLVGVRTAPMVIDADEMFGFGQGGDHERVVVGE
jgi:hypothetical protein